jgi:hypothetical protein
MNLNKIISIVDEIKAVSCGCPDVSLCNGNCKTLSGATMGNCEGFMAFSCMCFKGGNWIAAPNEC